jgi:hypothetical protein
MNTIPLVTFHDLKPALQLRDWLQRAGIEAQINDESNMEKYWFMSEPLAAVHVEVLADDYDAAVGMLRGRHDQRSGAMSGVCLYPGGVSPVLPQVFHAAPRKCVAGDEVIAASVLLSGLSLHLASG